MAIALVLGLFQSKYVNWKVGLRVSSTASGKYSIYETNLKKGENNG